jgi:hypothetical protein
VKTHTKSRASRDDKMLALFVGMVIEALFSPLAWWAFEIRSFQSCALLSAVCVVLFGFVCLITCEKKAERILTFIIRLLNP